MHKCLSQMSMCDSMRPSQTVHYHKVSDHSFCAPSTGLPCHTPRWWKYSTWLISLHYQMIIFHISKHDKGRSCHSFSFTNSLVTDNISWCDMGLLSASVYVEGREGWVLGAKDTVLWVALFGGWALVIGRSGSKENLGCFISPWSLCRATSSSQVCLSVCKAPD